VSRPWSPETEHDGPGHIVELNSPETEHDAVVLQLKKLKDLCMPRLQACHMRRRRIHACHMTRRIHACHRRRRIHACHRRRRIHACHRRRRKPACHGSK
jgi:hypothetical protein